MSTAMINPYNYDFIGRERALDAFHSLRSLRAQINALYVEADGGLGKTRVLEAYIKQCQQQRRPWHTSPRGSVVNPIIDFYDFENRTVAGLRRSMMERLGPAYFQAFQAKDAALQQAEAALKAGDTSQKSKVIALRLEVEQLFFQEFSYALREIKNYTVLFFDTFELVYNRRVGRWFLEEFLPSPAASGCLIVFAGRPRPFDLPANVYKYELEPFNENEAKSYFQEKWGITSTEPEFAVIEFSEGRPLLLDLAVHYNRVLNGRIQDTKGKSRADLERALVSRFLAQGEFLNEVILDMAYLKRHYNRAIYEHRRSTYTDSLDYHLLREQLQQFPFVKYHSSNDSFALHDKFQEMIADYGDGDWGVIADDLYQDIVQDWYNNAIHDATDEMTRDLLKAEQLAYILEKDRSEGIACYKIYFTEIQESLLFDFNDLLWGELEGHLGQNTEAYELTRAQANWLFDSSRHADAALLFERTISPQFNQVQYREWIGRDTIRLGHCYLRSGHIEQAGIVWEESAKVAQQNNNIEGLALFIYNLGHVRARQGHWDEALALYESAIAHAQSINDRNTTGQALFVMARLRAQQGEYRQAIGELKRGLSLIKHREVDNMPQAQAFIYAGEIYRYVGDVEAAKGYYSQANKLLTQLGGRYDWQAQTYAGLGAIYYLAGVRKRTEEWGDLAGDISDQQEAFHFLSEALNLVREHYIEYHLMLVLDRMADLYVELHELEILPDLDNIQGLMTKLQKELYSLNLVEEANWMYAVREPDKPFAALETLGKAQRLFEVAFLQAEKLQASHHVLDALVGAAGVAQKRGRQADIRYYATLADTLHGLDDPKQTEMFLALLDIFRCHLVFGDNPDTTIQQYAVAFAYLEGLGGFGWYRAQKELPELAKRLIGLGVDHTREYCQRLLYVWQGHPNLIAFINEIQDMV